MAPRLYLASSSPQRIRFLKDLKLKFVAVSPDIDECWCEHESPARYVRRLAIEKARRGADLTAAHAENSAVLGADTCVAMDDAVYGKPQDRDDAIRMLGALSGCVHQVHSAVAVRCAETETVDAQCSNVRFRTLSKREIDMFLDTGEYVGRAGAYAIQGAAAGFVDRLDGSYSTVVGMPMDRTLALLRSIGVAAPSYDAAYGGSKSQIPGSSGWSGEFWY